MSKLNKNLKKPSNIAWMNASKGGRANVITMPFKGVIPDETPYVGWLQTSYTWSYQAQYYVKARLIPKKQLDTGASYSKTSWKYFDPKWSGKIDSLNKGAKPDKKTKWYRYFSFAGKSLMTQGSYDRLQVCVRVRPYNPTKKQHGSWYTETIEIECVPTVTVHKVVALADGGCHMFLNTNGWTRGGSKVIFNTIKRNDTAELEALAVAESALTEKATVMTTAQAEFDAKKLESDSAKSVLAAKYQELAMAQTDFDMLPENATPEEIEAAQLAITEAQTAVEVAQALMDIAQEETDAAKVVLDAAAAEVEAATATKDAAQAAVDAFKPINKKAIELDMSAPGEEEAEEYPYITIPGSELNEGLLPSEEIKLVDCKFKTCDDVDASIDGVFTIDPVSAIINQPNISIYRVDDNANVVLKLSKSDPDDDWDESSAWIEAYVRGEKRRFDPVFSHGSDDDERFYRFMPPLDSPLMLHANVTNDLGGAWSWSREIEPLPSNGRVMVSYTDGTCAQPMNGMFYGNKTVVMNYDTQYTTDATREVDVELPHGRKRPMAFLAEGLKNTITLKGSIGATLDGSLETAEYSGYYDWLGFQEQQGLVLLRMPETNTYHAVCTKISITQADDFDETKNIDLTFEEVEV